MIRVLYLSTVIRRFRCRPVIPNSCSFRCPCYLLPIHFYTVIDSRDSSVSDTGSVSSALSAALSALSAASSALFAALSVSSESSSPPSAASSASSEAMADSDTSMPPFSAAVLASRVNPGRMSVYVVTNTTIAARASTGFLDLPVMSSFIKLWIVLLMLSTVPSLPGIVPFEKASNSKPNRVSLLVTIPFFLFRSRLHLSEAKLRTCICSHLLRDDSAWKYKLPQYIIVHPPAHLLKRFRKVSDQIIPPVSGAFIRISGFHNEVSKPQLDTSIFYIYLCHDECQKTTSNWSNNLIFSFS